MRIVASLPRVTIWSTGAPPTKEVSWLRLDPGDSVGCHQHVTNEDVYVIVSGEGIFKDKGGKDKAVKSGDIMIVRKGESHGIANTGKEPLVFVDVSAEQ